MSSGDGRYGRGTREDSPWRGALRGGARLGAARLALLALVAGCVEERPPEPPPAGSTDDGRAEPEVSPAVYRTGLTFVGFANDAPSLHFAFENRTRPHDLRRTYRGWVLRGGGWQTALSLRDSLPVPRAAWRVLPAPGSLALRVGEGGEVRGVRVESPDGVLRLDAGELLVAWSGDGGPRESLRAATLRLADGAQTGLLLLRQSARPAAEGTEPPGALAFVLADSAGDAILLLREGGMAEVAASAWTRLAGVETEWPDAVLRPLNAPAGSAGRWAVQLPDAGIPGEVEGRMPAVEEAPPSAPGIRLFRATGTFVVGGVPRQLAGVGVEER